MSDRALTVVVVDDQPVILAGLRSMLDHQPEIRVVGTATDGGSAVQVVADTRPDVVLMDIRMPGIDGIEATRRIVAAGTASAVIMITTFDDEDYLLESTRAGASGFLLKDAGPDLLAVAIRSAVRGDALIDPTMTRALLERRITARDAPVIADAQHTALRSLTDRERDVLLGLAQGLSNGELAAQLFLSEATVKTHVSRILMKIGGRTRVDAAVFAYESGFLRPGAGGRPA